MKRIILAATALLALSSSPTAQAIPHDKGYTKIGRYGSWQLYSDKTGCHLVSSGHESNGTYLTFFKRKGGDGVTLYLENSAWTSLTDRDLPISISTGGNSIPWKAQSFPSRDRHYPGVAIYFDQAQSRVFLTNIFRMRVTHNDSSLAEFWVSEDVRLGFSGLYKCSGAPFDPFK